MYIYVYAYVFITTCGHGGNHAAKLMGNAIHNSHRSHTDNNGCIYIYIYIIIDMCIYNVWVCMHTCVPCGNRASKLMGNAIHNSQP